MSGMAKVVVPPERGHDDHGAGHLRRRPECPADRERDETGEGDGQEEDACNDHSVRPEGRGREA